MPPRRVNPKVLSSNPSVSLGVVTLDDLRVFVAVCRAGSLSAVARELDCTQSAVSQHVKRLERETGVALLERQPRGVLPTRAGRVLESAAAEGIAGLDLALRHLRDLVDGESGTVRVATGATTVRHFMAEAVVAFRRQHPRVQLEFRTESSSRGCFDALADSDLDLAWITLGAPVRGIEQRPVRELPWVLAMRADDPLADRYRADAADLRELSGLRLIRLPRTPPPPLNWRRPARSWGCGSGTTRVSPTGTRPCCSPDWVWAARSSPLSPACARTASCASCRCPRCAPGGRLGGPPLGRAQPAGAGVRGHGGGVLRQVGLRRA